MPFLPSAKKKASTSVTASSNPSGTTTFNNHCLVGINTYTPPQNTAPCSIEHGNVNLARYIGAHSISMPYQQHEDWNSSIIWAHLFNKLHVLTNLCKKCLCKIALFRWWHELNSQLLPQQECLDLQMPEKLDTIFEYHQTWAPSLTVKQECDTAHAHTSIIRSDYFPNAAPSINCRLFSFK